MTNIVNIANTCINLSYWSMHFKKLLSIIIPKSNKSSYNTSKSFWPIVLLNTIRKLIKKAISNRIQIYTITLNFLHPNQLGGIWQHSTIDTEIFLTHIIHIGWIKGLHTSTLAFDIMQFFLYLIINSSLWSWPKQALITKSLAYSPITWPTGTLSISGTILHH